MTGSRSRRARKATVAGFSASCLLLSACGGGDKSPQSEEPAPPPAPESGRCEQLTLAYDPGKGYEASVFIVGSIAEAELGCEVVYRKTTSRQAWRLVARGQADAYLDAYGNQDLREKLAGPKGPVTVVGDNGVQGGVDLLVPSFMYEAGLQTSRDLDDLARVGWGDTPPLLTTLPELLPLAEAAVAFLNLDYEVLDYTAIRPTATMGDLFTVPSSDDSQQLPNVYLVEGPRTLLTTGQGRRVVDLPESAANDCAPDAASTLCSLGDFAYGKIVNTEFANSDSPAYNLIYNYRLGREPAAEILQLVALSGYRVNAADAASWINTHEDVWRRWLA